MTNLIQSNIQKNLISYVTERGQPSFKVSLRHRNFLKTWKNDDFSAFFRPLSGFRTIASTRVVGFLQNIVENLSLEIALLTMYKSYLFCEIPRRSSITLKPFLAMKEWSYVKFEDIYIPREKSELSEYQIRFRIPLLVFEISSFKERSFFVKIVIFP